MVTQHELGSPLRLKETGSIKLTIWISVKAILLNCWILQQKINYFSSMVSCMNRQMESLWVSSGSLNANAFMYSIEEKLEMENKLREFYRQYVDDICAVMQGLSAARVFRDSLNNSHPSVNFTMEMEDNRRLPFIDMEIIRFDHHLETCIYRKKTDKGLLLHHQSHVDNRYKRSLIKTMLNRAHWLSSTAEHFNTE